MCSASLDLIGVSLPPCASSLGTRPLVPIVRQRGRPPMHIEPAGDRWSKQSRPRSGDAPWPHNQVITLPKSCNTEMSRDISANETRITGRQRTESTSIQATGRQGLLVATLLALRAAAAHAATLSRPALRRPRLTHRFSFRLPLLGAVAPRPSGRRR